MTKSVFLEPYGILTQELVLARGRAALKQADVAQCLRKPQSFVSKYERGERRLDVIEFLAVCRVLQADAGEIIRKVQEAAPADWGI